MSVVVDEISAEVVEQPAADAQAPERPRRPPPDMARIRAALRRDAERLQRLWAD